MLEETGNDELFAYGVAQVYDAPVNNTLVDDTPVDQKKPPGSLRTKRLIYICSPYRPVDIAPKTAPLKEIERIQKHEIAANIDRARRACRIVVALGMIPMAPHIYFTQFMDDTVETERRRGMDFGLRWLAECDELWVFGERISEGMAAEIAKAKELGKEIRNLPEPARAAELLLKEAKSIFGIPDEDDEDAGDTDSNMQQGAAEREDSK